MTCWPSSTRRAASPRLHRHGPEPGLAHGHHRAPRRRGQALPVRDQGPLLQQDRRLLPRLQDEVVPPASALHNADVCSIVVTLGIPECDRLAGVRLAVDRAQVSLE